MPLDETHDPELRSWVGSANVPGCDFPIQNLPIGVFAPPNAAPRPGIAIGDAVLDLAACDAAGLFTGELESIAHVCRAASLNDLMSLGADTRRLLRRSVSGWLCAGSPLESVLTSALHRQTEVTMILPAAIGDYTDFYASIFHATNVGRLLRPDEPLLPNYKYVPIGYHGRASSIVTSGTPVRRPRGQVKTEASMEPSVAPSRRLDYELELAAFVGTATSLGSVLSIDEAEQHLFGVCLLNDWSARDIQAWEYQPLGPFLAKSFATTISPWIVTLDALEPFRVPAFTRSDDDPAPLPYLASDSVRRSGGFDIHLTVDLSSSQMREAGLAPITVSHSNTRFLYWTLSQLLTHQASNGCNLRPGDLVASGTVSGPTRESRGCLLESAGRDSSPLTLPSGETRRFLEDGDEVTFRGWCERAGAVRIGLGECRGRVLAAE
jgi:fumarylacetoacetase